MSTDMSGATTQDISGVNIAGITNPNAQQPQPSQSTQQSPQTEPEEQQIMDGILQDLHNVPSRGYNWHSTVHTRPPWRQ